MNYRVNKTVSNGNWSQGNPQALSLGINTITVSSVDFERTVNVQFSSGAVNSVSYTHLTLPTNREV